MAPAAVTVTVTLGLFVLFQVVFLFGYNLLDIASETHDYLGKQRDLWNKRPQNDPPRKAARDQGEVWNRVAHLPLVGGFIEDWVEKDEQSRLTKRIKAWSNYTDWWARKSGQEQGWSLFAPDTVDWTCLVRVEVRWDDDIEEVTPRTRGLAVLALTGGTAAKLLGPTFPPSRKTAFIQGYNEPENIHRYFRWGNVRWRRYESKFETSLRRHGKSEEEYLRDWEERAREKVHGSASRSAERKEIARYLKWKFERFQLDHPNLPPPRQVVLWCATWNIPAPPGPRPWIWESESEEPIVRWRPERFTAHADNLELYLHTEHRFENKITKPWLNRMPRSSD